MPPRKKKTNKKKSKKKPAKKSVSEAPPEVQDEEPAAPKPGPEPEPDKNELSPDETLEETGDIEAVGIEIEGRFAAQDNQINQINQAVNLISKNQGDIAKAIKALADANTPGQAPAPSSAPPPGPPLEISHGQGDNSAFKKRLDNMEASMVKMIDFIKGMGAGPTVDAAGQPIAPAQGVDPMTQQLGPFLTPLVQGALAPKNPYAAIGEAIVNNQLKQLTNPDADPVRQIGTEVVNRLLKSGLDSILNPADDTYQREYMKSKAKTDAERDSKAGK